MPALRNKRIKSITEASKILIELDDAWDRSSVARAHGLQSYNLTQWEKKVGIYKPHYQRRWELLKKLYLKNKHE